MALIVKTIGSGGGRDYTTIVAWVAALPANLVTDGNSQEGDCYNDATFDDGQISISGHTTDATHTITLTTGAGQSFRDKANAQSNVFNFSQANGVAISRSVNSSSSFIVGDDFVTVSNLQIRHAGATANGRAYSTGNDNNNTHVQFNNCIFWNDSTGALNTPVAFGGADTFRNCLIIAAGSTNPGVLTDNTTSGAVPKFYFCDLIASSDSTAPANLIVGTVAGTSVTTENCAFFGATAINAALGTYTHTTGMSDVASPPTGVTGSKTYANQFVNTTIASGDYRLKPGADLRGAATADATNGATDALGIQRPQLMRWDIGAIEFLQPYIDAEFPHFPVRRDPRRRSAKVEELAFAVPVPITYSEREANNLKLRQSWRARPQAADNEGLPFTAVVTPTRFYEEEAHGLERRRAWRAYPQPVDHEGFPFTAATPTSYYEEEAHRIELRRAWRAPSQAADNEGLPFTAMVTPTRFYEERDNRSPVRRLVHLNQTAPDEFILNPTQTVFAGWGFQEEEHGLSRRIRQLPYPQPDDADLGTVRLVGVPWAQDEPPFQRIVRRAWRSFPRQEGIDDIGRVQLVGAPWLDEPGQKPFLRQSLRRSQPDADGLPFTAAAPMAWADIEERLQAQPPPRRPLGRGEETLGPVQLVGAPWSQDEPPFQRIVHRSWRSFPRQEGIDDIGGIQLVGAPWGFDAPHHRQILRRSTPPRRHEDVANVPTTQPVGVFWIDDPTVRTPRRLPLIRIDAQDTVWPVTVAAPTIWREVDAFSRTIRRLSFLLPVLPDDINVPSPAVPWFDERARGMRSQRRPSPRAADEFLLFTASAAAGWVDIEYGIRPRRRPTSPRPLPDEVFQPQVAAAAGVAWGFDEPLTRMPRRSTRVRIRVEDESLARAVVVGALRWPDDDRNAPPRRRTRILRGGLDEFLPALLVPVPPPSPLLPHPGDLIPLIVQGAGKALSEFTPWENFSFTPVPIYVFFGAATIYTLPFVPIVNEWVRVKDNLGLASPSNPLTIFGPFEDGSSKLITQPYGSYDFVWNGTEWVILSFHDV